MQVFDPHVHFWDLDQGNQPWLENPIPNLLGDYRPMARNFGPKELFGEKGNIDVLGIVHVEADAVDPLAESRWLTSLMEKMAGLTIPSALVVGTDLSRSDANETLEAQLATSDRVRGVRQILNVHTDPLYDYVGRHFMAERTWQENFQLLSRLGLSFDLQIYPSQMPEAARLASENPNTQFILNHAGMYVDRCSLAGWREWREGLRLLAAQDNVSIKLSGFGMLDHHWTVGSIRPLILEAIDAFGISRCMFASNFPVDSLYSTYQEVWHAYDQVISDASNSEKHALFVENAIRTYRI